MITLLLAIFAASPDFMSQPGINVPLLQEMIAARYVQAQQHPDAPLRIYNYTPRAQYDRAWNEVTLATRGLILHDDYSIAARPFQKFFNLSELPPEAVPGEPFEVFDKLDGSLGILYWIGNEPRIATRGSFTGTQAVFATRLLHQKYAAAIPRLLPDRSYLFEIIYPANRIVVDYGLREELVLLAVIDHATGADLPLPGIGFPLVKRYDGITDLAALSGLGAAGSEGFVIRFRGGLRVKLKLDEYIRLHRILTGVSSLAIWEYLAEGKPSDELLERVPDEFYQWVQQTATGLRAQYDAIEAAAGAAFKVLDSRKETALYFAQQAHPAILFRMLDGRAYDDLIWKMIRPQAGAGFRPGGEAVG